MASKRRKQYLPIIDFPVYNSEFDRLRMNSNILNSEQRPNVHSIIFDRENIQGLLTEIIGDEKGHYKKRNETFIASIPDIKLKLRRIEEQFKQRQEKRINTGYEAYEKWPEDLEALKQKAHAEEDILLEEKEILEARLKNITDKIELADDTKVLQYGLICAGSFHGIGTSDYRPAIARAEIDGQFISKSEEGFLYIDDKRSPYDQMKVSDYHRLAKIWVKSRLEAEQLNFKKLQEQCKAEGKTVPSQPAATGAKKVDKKSLPKWPDFAIKYGSTATLIKEK